MDGTSWRIGVLGIALAVLCPLPVLPQPPPAGDFEERSGPQVAIYYDGPAEALAEGFLDANQVANLLGHFGLKARIFGLGEYQPGQLAGYRAAFFVGTAKGTHFPRSFFEDVLQSDKPFCWIGRHIGQLLNSPQARRLGFAYIDYRDDLEFGQVQYKGVTLPKEDPELNIIRILDPSGVHVLATASNADGETHPYAIRNQRFWYFADTPFSFVKEGGRYLVFCDLLHDILEIDHPASARALVRVEDVSTDSDPDGLRELTNLLARRNVPFQIALIPIFRKPSQGLDIRLSDRAFLVEALQYMIARGGTVIMHGVTHQYRGTSADDFEFWQGKEDRALPGDSADLVVRKLEMGLAECFAAGIAPIAFETPHYGASEVDYEAMKGVFQLFYERTMATPAIAATQYFPYPVIDRFGRRVVPENLGYIPLEDQNPKVLIARARNLRVVRDSVASFYFHPFLNPALLTEVVQGISDLGYHFVSIREFGGHVDYRGRYLITTRSGPARIVPDNEFWRIRVYDQTGNLAREQFSDERVTGPVEVAVEIPAGGWAALDCLKEAPVKPRPPGWREKFKKALAAVFPGRQPSSAPGFSSSGKAWLLWLDAPGPEDANNQQSYRTVLETFGYQVKLVPVSEFVRTPDEPGTVLIVSEAAGNRLTDSQHQSILRFLRHGGSLVADGKQSWLSALGLRWSGRSIPVSKVADALFPEMPLEWRPEESIERFTPPQGSRQLMVNPESRQTLAMNADYGSGHYLYLASRLDPYTPDATSHYPYFAEYMSESFRRRSALRTPKAEIYFDPGYRQGVDLSHLVATWRQAGTRIVYAGAWQFYPRYSFDYANFIRLCHQNGLAVYAWFIFPEVTPKMWEDHPEWRERTATGADGQVGWRLLMNFQNPDCFRASMDWMKGLLAAQPWDGVNVTELNYDADLIDPFRATKFVPMNPDVRAQFQAQAGFDPALLFSPASTHSRQRDPAAFEKFLSFREDLVTGWHRHVLEELAPVEQAHGWEVIITILDSLHSNYVRPALGLNAHRIIELMKEFDFTLQVEDSAEHWREPPDRYRRFAQTYLTLVPDHRRLMFDVNVIPNRDPSGTTLPSAVLTGTELARTVLAAASASGRAAIYAESTVPSQDWALIGEALSTGARLEGVDRAWNVTSPSALRLLASEDNSYYLDGQLWPLVCADGLFVPPGRHSLSTEPPWYRLFDRHELSTRLIHTSADILDAHAMATGLSLRYASSGPAVMVLNQKPDEVLVDGRPVPLAAHAAGENWWMVAPRGEHRLQIATTSQAGMLLNRWSWFSSSAIVLFGALTSVLMALIYVQIRFRRHVRSREAG